MVIKLEECINILKAIHPGIDLIFLFDHSCGNDRGIEEVFNVMKMNSRYGAEKINMNPKNINLGTWLPCNARAKF